MKVVSAPPIRFKCTSCGAENEGEPEEFTRRNTMPPTWLAKCAFCQCVGIYSPTPLIARLVGGIR